MQFLADKIGERLKTHKSCTIFENDLSRVWPLIDTIREQRYALIHAFARAHGWSATIRDPGMRVTFRKLKPGQTNKPSPELAKAS